MVIDAHEGRELGRFTRYVSQSVTPRTSDPPKTKTPRSVGTICPVPLSVALSDLDRYLQQLIGLSIDQVGQQGGQAAFATCGVWDCNLVQTHCRANGIQTPAAFSTWVDVVEPFGEEHGLKEVRGLKTMLSKLKLLDKEGQTKVGLNHPFGLHGVQHLARAVLHLLKRGIAFHLTSEIDVMEPQQGEAPKWIRAMSSTVELQEAWECFESSVSEDDQDADEAAAATRSPKSLAIKNPLVFARYGNIRRLFGTLLERDAVYHALNSAGYRMEKTIHKKGTGPFVGRWEIECQGDCFEVHQGFEDNAAPPQPLVDTIVQGTKGWTMETLDKVAVALGHAGPDWAPRQAKVRPGGTAHP